MLNDTASWSFNIKYVTEKGSLGLSKRGWLIKNWSLAARVRRAIYLGEVRPKMEYAAGVWHTRGAATDKLEVVQNRAAKQILGVGSKTPTAAVLGELGLVTLPSRRQIQMLRTYARLRTMPKNRLPRQVWEEVERTSGSMQLGRGRPRLTWASSLKKAMCDLNLPVLPWDASVEESRAWINEATKAAEASASARWEQEVREKARTKLDMFAVMNVPFGFKEWLRGPTTPASSYLVRFRAGCPPIGEELRRRAQTNDDGPREK